MSTIKTGTTLTTAYQVVGDTTGALVIQTGASPTTAATFDTSQNTTVAGNLTLSGTGKRITGDFSGASTARVMVQSSTTNGATAFGLLPNGTSTTSSFTAFANSDPTNANGITMSATGTEARFYVLNNGTSSAVPMTFYTSGSERMRVDTSGNVAIGGTTAAEKLHVYGSIRIEGTSQIQLYNSGYFIKASTGLEVQSADFIRFLTSGANERMRIDTSGNVGIGTSSPTTYSGFTTLEVGGTAGLFSAKHANGNALMYNSAGVAVFGSTAAYATNFISNSVLRASISSTGQMSTTNGAGVVALAYDARVWVNFNGTGTVAIRGSGNVSSITDGGVGIYAVNFTTAMPDVNYAVVLGGLNSNADANNILRIVTGYASAVGSCNVYAGDNSSDTLTDVAYVHVAVLR
jgi:hypothetical protein